MIATVFRAEDYQARDRFDAWCDLVAGMPCPYQVRSDHAADYGFTLRTARLGAATVAHTSVPSIHAIRTPRMIRQADDGVYTLELCRRGRIGAEQSGREVAAAAGQWIVQDSCRPHSLWSVGQGHRSPSAVGLAIPKSVLGLSEDAVAPLLAGPLPGDTGFGGMITDVIGRVLREPGAFGPADAPRLGEVLRDLVAAMFAHELDAGHLLPEETHSRALILRIQAFVLAHLGDRDLTPGTIAAAHHISVGYLHRLFRRDGRTVAAWIRTQRLERARCDLADPTQRATPVQALAARWGFAHASDFSRAFRRAYGTSPRDYREGTQG
ncbi:helix-turn-helix domain-containing protein [Actinomadura rubrisoli]|uniref:Helix-turn-helix domain-containing protein n=1 Tax=Actinomadura rubrisoli TaxID=2530368 RepID=A0A4R5BUY6_9ACTN|nr:helix-turn-helix domain-containing protein [Actinomadura rubrisoli]TDD88024.1 helix-turn-helix domain-containing protein [Actinomadura rubrisoli]